MANAWLEPSSEKMSDPATSAIRDPGGKVAGPEVSYSVDHLRARAASGALELDALLAAITTAAFELAEATGSALALRTQGAVVCRARTGKTAPPLGTRVEEASGISGECMRTGVAQNCCETLADARVDPETCLQLSIRSLAVVPVRDTVSVIGILEVFSDRPQAFNDSHISLLHQLAEIAVMCREQALRNEVLADPVAPSRATVQRSPAWESAAAGAPRAGNNRRLLPVAASAIAAIALIALLGWMAWRGVLRGRLADRAQHETATVQGISPAASPLTNNSAANLDQQVTRVNSASGTPDANSGTPASDLVTKASSTAPLRREATPQVVPLERPSSRAGASARSSLDELNPPEISQFSGTPNNELPPAFVTAPDQSPQPALAVSQVAGGTLVRGNPPIYPLSAKTQRIEGAVVLAATVLEDGTVHDLQVVSGNPVLADAAKRAVARWQYAPFLLNGRPVSKRTQITVQFKLP